MLAGAATFRAWLLERAQVLGFARVGLASCEPFTQEVAHRTAWLEAGGARWMPYLAQPDWIDPRSVLPSARTALVGFFPYARPRAVPGSAPDSVRLSRYVWGPDYHMVLKGRLSTLLREAQALEPSLEGRVCVDTAPILERQLAVRAGLGWQGRNTLLIAHKAGSWGFLGVLLLSEELSPNPPYPGQHCGTCTACLEACPTGALSPFRLDPNRCLTTFTVETEAPAPPEVVEAIQRTRWVVGCDLCQEVCPWNRSPLWGDPELWGGPSPLHTLPLGQLSLNGSQYRRHIKRTALRRIRHRQWLRWIDLLRDSIESREDPALAQGSGSQYLHAQNQEEPA